MEAGELLKASMLKKDKRGIEAEGHASEAALLDTFIDEMERVANNDSLMVKLSAIIAVKPETEEPLTED